MLLSAIAALVVATSLSIAPATAQDATRLIIKLRPETAKLASTPKTRIERLAVRSDIPLRHVRSMALGADVVTLPGMRAAAAAQALEKLRAQPNVEFADIDRRRYAEQALPINDEFAMGQQYLSNDPGSISAFDAWVVTHGSSNTVVAVVDSGYRPHAGMLGRFLPGYDMISDPLIANDGDGRDVDALDPGDWVEAGDQTGELADCEVAPSSWHGTGVAGIIAANTDDGIWTAGIDWNAKILPVRVLGKCFGYDSDIIDGIAWAAGLPVPEVPANPTPAQIINLSLGGPGSCSAPFSAVIAAAFAHGVTRAIVVAAGNAADDVANHEPANCPGVIAVASTRPSGSLARYSNFGTGIAVSAPGGTLPIDQPGDDVVVLSNDGPTTPQNDSIRDRGGTSLAAPMVSGAISLMLAVAPSLSPDQIASIVMGTAKPFPPGSDCTTDRCGAGILDAGAAVRAATANPAPPINNYEGMWWNAPAESESGWGINFAHQGDVIGATWFTYDMTGKALWLLMRAMQTASRVFSGPLYQMRGPAFNAIPFSPAAVTATQVGSGTLTFGYVNNATFAYTVNGIMQTKLLTRAVFGPLPTCTFGAQANLALATNYQDIWWAAPAGFEGGWGLNLVQQGDTIVGTWFTYDFDGTPLWLIVPATSSAPGVFSGILYRSTGPAFNAMPFSPANVAQTQVGMATLTFTDGNNGTFDYTVNGVHQVKPITREVFRAPGTICR